MFEDLIVEKPKCSTGIVCPHCDSSFTTKYGGLRRINERFRHQRTLCTVCNKEWYIIYDNDMKQIDIEHIKGTGG